MTTTKPIPVILDTDIGGDIDDTWAIAMMLNCPELDVKLIVSDTGNTIYRSKLITKFLDRAGRGDIPVGIGVEQESDGPRERQAEWVKDYDLSSYSGTVFTDGIQAIIDTIKASTETMTLICIGPVTNIAEVIKRQPDIAPKVRFVGMHGSIYRQHRGIEGAIPEFNVVQDIAACQTVFDAPWKSMTITPLDTCGIIQLKGDLYRRIYESDNQMLKDLIDNYRIWCNNDPIYETESSILYDTVAIHLAYSESYLKMESIKLLVDEEGFTRKSEHGQPINVAIDWTDLDGYYQDLVNRLIGCQKYEIPFQG